MEFETTDNNIVSSSVPFLALGIPCSIDLHQNTVLFSIVTWSLAVSFHQNDGAMHRTCQYQHKAKWDRFLPKPSSLGPPHGLSLFRVLACHPPSHLEPFTVASCLSIQCRFRHGRMLTPEPWMAFSHLVTQDTHSLSHSQSLTLTHPQRP